MQLYIQQQITTKKIYVTLLCAVIVMQKYADVIISVVIFNYINLEML